MKKINFFPKFNELNDNSLNVDFHLHSTWTDGKQSVEEIFEYAQKKGLRAIAITDHIRKESTYFEDYKKLINSLKNTKNGCDIYCGFEAKVLDFNGNIDVKKDIISQSDIAIVSVHRFPLGKNLYNAIEFKKNIAQEIEIELSLAAIKTGGFNVMGHPGGMCLRYFKEFPKKFLEKIILACKANEIAFDLSGSYHRNVLSDLAPLLEKHNPHISIGSDSHSIDTMFFWNKELRAFII